MKELDADSDMGTTIPPLTPEFMYPPLDDRTASAVQVAYQTPLMKRYQLAIKQRCEKAASVVNVEKEPAKPVVPSAAIALLGKAVTLGKFLEDKV